MKFKNVVFAYLALSFLLGPVDLGAQGSSSNAKPEVPPGIPAEVIEKLRQLNIKANLAAAQNLGVPLASITTCRDAGFDLLFTMVLVVIADEAKVRIEDAIETRLSGYVWGEMCQAWGVSWQTVQERVSKAQQKMFEDKIEFPPTTPSEINRATNNGRWRGPLKGKP